jgi:BirA family biotin operon repressor/biotin-[acetyl-CoA-carboxylase] ligase
MARALKLPPAGSRAPPLAARVYGALADGQFHSGEELAAHLGVSRSAVWKAMRALKSLGTPFEAVRNRGYRLTHAAEPLEPAAIREALEPEARAAVTRIDVAWTLESTNSALLARPNPPSGACEVLLAEYQSAGRGRRGRTWLAPPGGSICLSFNWTFREVPRDLAGLGLAIGVCARRALIGLGAADVALKWPNDLLVHAGKLGGVLIELRAEAQGPACVVVGIGMNVALGKATLRRIAAAGAVATDLAGAGLASVPRNRVVAALVSSCIAGLRQFEREALKPFIADWGQADALHGKPVDVSGPQGVVTGLASGVDVHGALLLDTPNGVLRFISGDVSVRPSE